MKKLLEFIILEFKLLFRVPIELFFTILFPQMLMCVFVFMNGNNKIFNGCYFIDIYLPIMMLLSLFSSGIISFAVIVAGNRSEKLWQLYRIRGFKLWQIILSEIFVNVFLTFIGCLLLVISAKIFFNAKIGTPWEIVKFLMIWIIMAISTFMIGFVVGVLCKSEKTAQSVSTPIMFILMICSGIMVRYDSFPESIQKIMSYLPTTQSNWILVKYWANLDTSYGRIKWYVIFIWLLLSISVIVYKLYKDDFERI